MMLGAHLISSGRKIQSERTQYPLKVFQMLLFYSDSVPVMMYFLISDDDSGGGGGVVPV